MMISSTKKMDPAVPAALKAANPRTEILPLDDPAFAAYGRIIAGIDISGLLELADRTTSIDPAGNTYIPGVPEFEALDCTLHFRRIFGGIPPQVGYCNGPNRTMNGMEYHKSSELNAAVTDSVLFLGRPEDMEDYRCYPSAAARAFYIPRGILLELHPRVLHLSPCAVHASGFKMIIVLPSGTNLPLDQAPARSESDNESRLLFKNNKWMIAHPERTQLTSQGVHPGLTGENRGINPQD